MRKMERWIKELLDNLDHSVDGKTRQRILENCGSRCPFSHMPDNKLLELRSETTTEEEFLGKLSEIWRLRKVDDRYFVIFDRCYCPLVYKNRKSTSKTMCYCTLGSLKHKFKISLGRDIDVIMLKTVLTGDEECRFEIKIKG